MNTNEINSLLEKFYQGETTLEEEKLLQKHFAENNDDNENFAAEKYLFSKLNLAENIEMPSGLTDKIVAMIDSGNKKRNTVKFTSFMWLRAVSIAACCALLLSVSAMILFNGNGDEPKYIANVSTSEIELMEMLEHSFSKISTVVDDAFAVLDVTGEQVCEFTEALGKL